MLPYIECVARVLIVDDDTYILDLYKEILENEKFTVSTATDGEEALDKINSSNFDLMLLDVMMPKLDGMSVLAQVKKDSQHRDLPVIILTNFGQESLIRQAYDLGAADFLLKYKVTPGEMAQRINHLIKQKESDK